MYDVFISYRREGGLDLAGRIKDHLSQKGFCPFYDVETMKSGRFDKQIYDRIDECKHFLLILPPKGLARCKNKEDWVRKEIEYAIKKKKHIVTVLMPGFSFPKKLPGSLEMIRLVQAVEPTPDSFEHTIDKICGYLNDTSWSPAEYEEMEKGLSSKRKNIWSFMMVTVLILGLLFISLSWFVSSDAKNNLSIEMLEIEGPIRVDDTIVFNLYYTGSEKVRQFDVGSADIMTVGFVADLQIHNSDSFKQIIISNIKHTTNGTDGGYIVIAEGVVTDSDGKTSQRVMSETIDFSKPALTISAPSVKKVESTATVTFTVAAADNEQVTLFRINKEDIALFGFTADIEVSAKDTLVKEITFKNIQSISANEKYFTLSEGVAVDEMGNKSVPKTSSTFTVINAN